LAVQFFASCPPGIADLTAAELRACGATHTRELKLGVLFEGTLETAYRACLWSRTASRVLMPLGNFPAATPEALYEGVAAIDWTQHVASNGTLAIEFGGSSAGIKHTHFGALKTKDAIVDQLRERTGQRPSVELERPDVRLDVRLDRERATLSLDLSGDSLHRRAYRARGVAAPLKENLAAAVLLRSGWPALAESGEFVDPMCGSGTLVIEAAMMALDIAPGLLRSHFGFVGWRGHDRELWQRLVDEARGRREATASRRIVLRGYDSDAAAIRAAIENSERAQLRGFVHFERRELEQLVKQSEAATGLLATNPPYGERIGDQERLQALYATLGQKLREHFQGWKAAVLTGNPPLAKAIGIHARRSHTLYNGRIECRLLRFEITPEDFQQPRGPAPDAAEMRARPGAQMFANRLRKNLKSALDWAQRESVDCFRIYDADMPEYAFAIDQYGDGAGNRWVVVQEYAPPRTVDAKAARQRRDEALAVIPHELEIPADRLFVRERRQQKQGAQYEKLARQREFEVVREQPYRFFVNFTDYLDTGLFLDHRPTRRLIAGLASGKRFLNLFAYTGTATVYAVGGGASASTTLDMSRTYLDWAKRNLALNELAGPAHGFVQANCLTWLEEQRAAGRRWDLMFIDPPTHSRSKRMTDDFDVQRDHARLLNLARELLTPRGTIVFSSNYTRFKLERCALGAFEIEDISRNTVPEDFSRNLRIHSCFLLRSRG
jgi:23S rRNA (guanine2445-N2)-methyltransferase / 23S rRNA (guanine2069-N7)-methyltransferase